MNELFDTVAAVTTPRGKGGVAVIRISGQNARDILARVFTPSYRAPATAPRRACLGKIVSALGVAVLFFVQFHTEAGQTFQRLGTDFGTVPSDTTAKDDGIQATHGGCVSTDILLDTVGVSLHGVLAVFVSCIGCLLNVSQVVGNTAG